MKKILSIAALLLSLTAAAQTKENILPDYYGLKNALVSDDPKQAATYASSLRKDLEKNFPEQKTLVNQLNGIMTAKSISEQRHRFMEVSTGMYQLVKKEKITSAPVYYQYCPMKKAYWLSAEAAIKNPYYGNEMLTCGKVSETIK